MYGKQVKQTPATEQKQYLSEGINENIFVKSATLGSWSAGKCCDIVFSDDKGATIADRVFPFNYSGGKLSKLVDGKSVALTEDEELEAYLLRFKHIFSACVGEENYDKAVSKATDFESFVNILGKMSKDNYKDSKSFRIMLISKENKKDGKYYTQVPKWSNGFIESMDELPKMKFNSEKYGRKTVDTAKVEKTVNTSTTDSELPF